MKDIIITRLDELSEEIEKKLKDRETHIKIIKQLDNRISVISSLMLELKDILEKKEKDNFTGKKDE